MPNLPLYTARHLPFWSPFVRIFVSTFSQTNTFEKNVVTIIKTENFMLIAKPLKELQKKFIKSYEPKTLINSE